MNDNNLSNNNDDDFISVNNNFNASDNINSYVDTAYSSNMEEKKENPYSFFAVICSLFIILAPFGIIFAFIALSRGKEYKKGLYGATFALTLIIFKFVGIGVGYFSYDYFLKLPIVKNAIFYSIGCDKINYSCLIDDNGNVTCSLKNSDNKDLETKCGLTLDTKVYSDTVSINGKDVLVKYTNYAYGSSGFLKYDKFFVQINDKTIGSYSFKNNYEASSFQSKLNSSNLLNIIDIDGTDYILIYNRSDINAITDGVEEDDSHVSYFTLFDENANYIGKIDLLESECLNNNADFAYVDSDVFYFVPSKEYLSSNGYTGAFPYFTLKFENGIFSYIETDKIYTNAVSEKCFEN